LLGFFGNLIFRKTDIPSVLWLVGFGLILGPITGIVEPSFFISVSGIFSTLAIIIILFDGGLYLDIYKLFKEFPRSMTLAVTGFVFMEIATIAVMAGFGYSIFHGIIMGAIVGGTCSPTVITIVNKLKGVREETQTIIDLETSLTDVFSIVIVIATLNAMIAEANFASALQFLASGFSIGAMTGLLLGLVWLPIMRKLLEFDYSYLVTLAMLFLLYSLTEMLGGNGAISCLLFGVVLANGRKIYGMLKYENLAYEIDATTKSFHSLIAFLVTTFFFVYLGLIVTIKDTNLLMIGLILTVVALATRYAATWLSTYRGDFNKLERRVIWMLFPRGLTAAVLAYLPISRLPDQFQGFADIVFAVIISSVIIATIGIAVIERKYPQKKTIPQVKVEK
jgi:cell volume regulation protein A